MLNCVRRNSSKFCWVAKQCCCKVKSFTQGENGVSGKHMLGDSLRGKGDNSCLEVLHLASLEFVVSGWCEDKQEEDGKCNDFVHNLNNKLKIVYY